MRQGCDAVSCGVTVFKTHGLPDLAARRVGEADDMAKYHGPNPVSGQTPGNGARFAMADDLINRNALRRHLIQQVRRDCIAPKHTGRRGLIPTGRLRKHPMIHFDHTHKGEGDLGHFGICGGPVAIRRPMHPRGKRHERYAPGGGGGGAMVKSCANSRTSSACNHPS